jgi:hypothetical protein
VTERRAVVIVISRQHAKMHAAMLASCAYIVVADPIEETAPRLDALRDQLEKTEPAPKRPHWDRRSSWGKPWR